MMQLKLFVQKLLPAGLLKTAKSAYREARGSIKSVAYKGYEVYCNCCNKYFSRFADFKYSKALSNSNRFKDTYKHIDCPYCYSHPRHRIVCYFLDSIKEKLKESDSTVLMVGAEYAIEKWLRLNRINYTTADLFDRTADVKTDIQHTPFAGGSWSLIICNHVLEHVPNVALALKEMKRILKQDGILEISVPTDRTLPKTIECPGNISGKERIEAFGQIDHMRIFGNDVETLLASAGFSVEVINGNVLPKNIRAITGPASYDDNRVYLCRKK